MRPHVSATPIPDYYLVLGVDSNATKQQIGAAFRRMAKVYHPDMTKDPASAEKFKEVHIAYEILSDSQKRQNYDRYQQQHAAKVASPSGAEESYGGQPDVEQQPAQYAPMKCQASSSQPPVAGTSVVNGANLIRAAILILCTLLVASAIYMGLRSHRSIELPYQIRPTLEQIARADSGSLADPDAIENEIRRRTLGGLEGVCVLVEGNFSPRRDMFLPQNCLDESVVTVDIEKKLRMAGIKVLSEAECARVSGRPTLSIRSGVHQLIGSDTDFAVVAGPLVLEEDYYLARTPDITLHLAEATYRGGTYAGDMYLPSGNRTDIVQEVRASIGKLVDAFINDYRAADSKPVVRSQELYPQPTTVWDIRNNPMPLRSLRGVHVPQLKGNDLSVQNVVIPRLENAGIKVLSSEYWDNVRDGDYPKTPYLFVKGLVMGNSEEGFGFYGGVLLKLVDKVMLMRNPKIVRQLPIWEPDTLSGESEFSRTRSQALQKLTYDMQDQVDQFINDYLAANPK